MPPMMTKGNTSAHTPLRNDAKKRPSSNGGRRLPRCSRRATSHQVAASVTAIISPGKIPAMNNLVIDSCVVTPKTTSGIDGGTTGAMQPAEAISPAERGTL